MKAREVPSRNASGSPGRSEQREGRRRSIHGGVACFHRPSTRIQSTAETVIQYAANSGRRYRHPHRKRAPTRAIRPADQQQQEGEGQRRRPTASTRNSRTSANTSLLAPHEMSTVAKRKARRAAPVETCNQEQTTLRHLSKRSGRIWVLTTASSDWLCYCRKRSVSAREPISTVRS